MQKYAKVLGKNWERSSNVKYLVAKWLLLYHIVRPTKSQSYQTPWNGGSTATRGKQLNHEFKEIVQRKKGQFYRDYKNARTAFCHFKKNLKFLYQAFIYVVNKIQLGADYNGPKFKCQPVSGTG